MMTKQKHRRANFPIKTKLEAVKLWISCKKSGPEICEEYDIDLSSLPRWRDTLVSKGLLSREEAYPFRAVASLKPSTLTAERERSEPKASGSSLTQINELQTQIIEVMMENAKLRTRIAELEILLSQSMNQSVNSNVRYKK